jgi:hypothetical protein
MSHVINLVWGCACCADQQPQQALSRVLHVLGPHPCPVQLPCTPAGGERVAFLFTIKQLDAKGTLDSFSGDFVVPSYRGSSFLDPKGRGGSTGYDNAVALPARADAEELLKENVKSTKALKVSSHTHYSVCVNAGCRLVRLMQGTQQHLTVQP